MYKPVVIITTTVILTVVLLGCHNVAVPRHEYDVLKENNSRLAAENQRLIRQAKDAEARAKTAEDRVAAAEAEARIAAVGIFHEEEKANKLPEEYVINRETGGIVLDQAVLFDLGKAVVKPAAKEILLKLVQNVLNAPEYRNHFVRIDGHSDATPVKASAKENIDNWWLSGRRAHAVMVELGKLGVKRERMFIVGHGPTAPREKHQKSALNRRVEIMVKKKKFNREPESGTGE
jgi:chemotaxis protein MotB